LAFNLKKIFLLVSRYFKYQLTEEKCHNIYGKRSRMYFVALLFYFRMNFHWEFFTQKAETPVIKTWSEIHSFMWSQCLWSLTTYYFTIRI